MQNLQKSFYIVTNNSEIKHNYIFTANLCLITSVINSTTGLDGLLPRSASLLGRQFCLNYMDIRVAIFLNTRGGHCLIQSTFLRVAPTSAFLLVIAICVLVYLYVNRKRYYKRGRLIVSTI